MKHVDGQWQQQGNLYERLSAIRMSESDRQLALASIRGAERFCEGYGRIAGMSATMGIALVVPLRRWLSQSR